MYGSYGFYGAPTADPAVQVILDNFTPEQLAADPHDQKLMLAVAQRVDATLGGDYVAAIQHLANEAERFTAAHARGEPQPEPHPDTPAMMAKSQTLAAHIMAAAATPPTPAPATAVTTSTPPPSTATPERTRAAVSDARRAVRRPSALRRRAMVGVKPQQTEQGFSVTRLASRYYDAIRKPGLGRYLALGQIAAVAGVGYGLYRWWGKR